jgi:hypothetical protein
VQNTLKGVCVHLDCALIFHAEYFSSVMFMKKPCSLLCKGFAWTNLRKFRCGIYLSKCWACDAAHFESDM